MSNIKEIILVEDNTDDADLILRIFQRHSLSDKTLHLMNGEEVLNLFFTSSSDAGQLNPKLILLDIKMPKVDGFTVLEALKGNEETKMIPVLIFSSSKVEEDIFTAYKKGANGYVVKPMDFEEFENVVERIITFWIGINEVNGE